MIFWHHFGTVGGSGAAVAIFMARINVILTDTSWNKAELSFKRGGNASAEMYGSIGCAPVLHVMEEDPPSLPAPT